MRTLRHSSALALGVAILGLLAQPHASLDAQPSSEAEGVVVDPALLDGLQFRSLGFSRGGRSTAAAGVPSQPLVYYFGATGGGVWKTSDAGVRWNNVSDGFFEAGSIGAIAVADSDPNVVYVGTGSACPRGNISPGVGMYRSTNAGKTWTHIGLRGTSQIGRLRVHPTDHDLVYAAVLGNLFGASPERGVFRSKDGGATWEKVLFISDTTGVVDLAMDPTNPRVLYAGAWAVKRSPWSIDSGSMDGGIYRSIDGGDTWARLAGGLPNDVMLGKTGVAVSPANPERVWALIEAADDMGGVYRSDDGGDTWRRINDQRMLQQRAWYYTHIYADPLNANTVYALNTGFYKSTDGGRTFERIAVPHGDNHDLWINPTNASAMINANDGGVNVSFTGGSSWSTQMNQPTAEFYRVAVDTRFPYRVYGAQQDNSTVSVSSVPSGGRGATNFYSVGGGESGHIAVDPRDPSVVYAGSYGGSITRMDTDSRLSTRIRAYPDAQTGQRAADMRYRFQWNAPIRISPHDADVVYHTSQVVHRTRDGGHSWEVISPDLSRNDPDRQDYSGGQGITRDNTGVEVYGTIFAFEESPQTPGLLWAGTDDGRVHVSRDDGANWTEITPSGMPEGVVNAIDLSAHDPGRAHIAVYRYRQDDSAPYIYQTSNYGTSWTRLTDGTNGIPENHFVRVVREDPDRRGLLYAGSEFGLYVSFDDGAHWQSLQLNLPTTPVTDLLVHDGDLVVATQGRAFWVLDNLAVLQKVDGRTRADRAQLFAPEDGYRSGHLPVAISYYLAAEQEELAIEILDSTGGVIARYSGAQGGEGETDSGSGGSGEPVVPTTKGLNTFEWNARHDRLFEIPRGIVMWGGNSTAPKVVPGSYQTRVTAGDWSQTAPLTVKADPRLDTTQADYGAQLALARRVGSRVKELYDHLGRLRDVKSQATDIGDRLSKGGHGREVAEAAEAMNESLTAIESELTQLQGEGGQDALNFPGQLDNQLVTLYSEIVNRDAKPTQGSHDRFADLQPLLDDVLTRLTATMAREVDAFNELVGNTGTAALIISAPPTN